MKGKGKIRNRDAGSMPGPGKAPLKTGVAPNLAQPAGPSSSAFGLNIGTVVSVQNHWREYYNPLRALNIQRYIALYDFSRRGLNAELQNVYREMEQLFPCLVGLISRRMAPLLTREFIVKTVEVESMPKGCTQAMADDQADCLRQAYSKIDNLHEAVRWMELGFFRGYAHLEKIYANPGTSDFTVCHFEPIEQWHWTRKSMYAQWEYVAAATQTNVGVPINYEQFIIREMPWALDRLALLLWIRANLAEKDWDAFVELYGIPKWVVTMPPNVPKEKESEYQSAARAVAGGASGALPAGSELNVSDAKTEGKIFNERLTWIQEQLVLAGTGGMLTMLSKPTGLGKGAADVHNDAFNEIGEMTSVEISEVFNRQFDAPILDREFPGQPRLAFAQLAPREETDIDAVCRQVLQLSQSGYQVDPQQITDKTGYRVNVKIVPPPLPPKPGEEPDPTEEPGDGRPQMGAGSKITNRAAADVSADLIEETAEQYSAALQQAFKPLASRLYAILELDDPGLELNAMKKLRADLNNTKSKLFQDIMSHPDGAQVLYNGMSAGLLNGMAENISTRTTVKNGGPGSGPRPGGGEEIRETRVPLHPAAAQKLGVESDKVFADHAALAKKHPEYFNDSHEAKAYIDHVASRPTHVFPGNQPDHALIVRKDGENKAFAMDVEKRGGKFRVRSAHTLNEDQFQTKLKSAGPGATLGVSRVNSREAKTPSRLLSGPHGTPPTDIHTILDRIASVK